MKEKNTLLYFLIILALFSISPGTCSRRFRRRTSTIRHIVGCYDNRQEAEKHALDPKNSYFIGLLEIQSPGLYANFVYRIIKKKKYSNPKSGKYRIIIKPFELNPGNYVCKFTFKHNKFKKTFRYEKYLEVKKSPPIAVIEGGDTRTAPSQFSITLTANSSVKTNLKDISPLVFRWFCEQKLKPWTFCIENKTVSQTSELVIPKNHMENGEEFVISLRVSTRRHHFFGRTEQIIRVADHKAFLSLRCQINCENSSVVSYTSEETKIEVFCEAKCNDVKDFQWKVTKKNDDKFEFDYSKNSHGSYGPHNNIFTIYKDSLKPGNYIFSVKIVNSRVSGEADMSLKFVSKPSIGNCYTIPREGVISETTFNFFCEQSDEKASYLYEIYFGEARSVSKGHEFVISGLSPDVFNFDFHLTHHRGYKVRITDLGTSAEVIVNLDCKMTRAWRERSPNELLHHISKLVGKILGEKYAGKSVKKLMESEVLQERKVGMDVLQTVVNEMHLNLDKNENDIQQRVEDLKFLAGDEFAHIPTPAISDLLHVLDALLSKIQNPTLNATAELNTFKGATCRMMAVKLIESVKAVSYTKEFGNSTHKIQSKLRQCLDTDTKPIGLITTKAVENTFKDVIAVTECTTCEMEIIDFERIVELEDMTYDNIRTVVLVTSLLPLIIPPGKTTQNTTVGGADAMVVRDKVKNVVRRNITLQNLTLFPSGKFGDDDKEFLLYLFTYKKNILWWDTRLYTVVTAINMIAFHWVSTVENIAVLENPVRITLRQNEYIPPLKIYNETFQYRYVNRTLKYPDYLNRLIHIKRVEMPRKETLRVTFYNLTDDDVFDVVITYNQFPDARDFKKANKMVVTRNKPYVMYDMDKGDYAWVFVAILPSTVNTLSLYTKRPYKTSYQVSGCVYWKMESYSWLPTCEAKSHSGRNDVVECECKKFSMIAGYLQDIKATEQKVLVHDFTLKIVPCYTIYLTLFVTYCLYYIFILFAAFKKKENFYFLADNLKHHRYAYLLVVKTGSKYNSGTTSIVVVRLIGRKGQSDAHVINYPDPEMRLLQRFGEDTFVLTTEIHLGEIQEIEMWYTCIGSSPSWLCRDIVVYDMQIRREWYFDINKRFFVVTGLTYIKATPTTKKLKSKESFISKIQFCSDYHTWFLFSSQEKFAYIKRLTVVFSTILFTYTNSLLFLGLPKFDLRDAFDKNDKYSFDIVHLKFAFSCSLCSFVLHTSIAWIFRNSKIQFSRHKNQDAPLPLVVTLICWAVVVAIITVCTVLLVAYGFWVPRIKSFIWLTISGMGIIFDILIYGNLMSAVHSYFSKAKLIANIDQNFDKILTTIETQRSTLYKRFGSSLFRQHLEHLYTPLKHGEILRRKIIVKHRLWIASQLKDMLMFTIYFIMLNLLISSTRTSNTLDSKITIEEIMKGSFTRTMSFEDVQSISDFYFFIEETLIPAMQPTYWYKNFTIGSEGLMLDMSNKFLGIARMRQHRSKPNLCTVPENMRFLFNSCSPEFTAANEETRDFIYKWKPYSKYSFVKKDRLGWIWRHINSSRTTPFSAEGEFATYPGGGYIAKLGRRPQEAYAKIRAYKMQQWIDPGTRCVLIEFLTYSANSNMFNAVRLFFERSVTGKTKTTVSSQAAVMLKSDTQLDHFATIVYYVYHVTVLVLAVKHLIRIITNLKTFFKDVWFMIDLLLTILNVVTLVLFLYRDKFLKQLAKDLESEHHNRFIYYFINFYLEDAIIITTSLVLTIATLRLWRFFRFGLIFRLMERTLAIACFPLISAAVAFFILLSGFGCFGLMLLGNEFEDFSTVMDVFRTLITMCLKPDQFDIRNFLIAKIIYAYFSLYLMIMQIVLFVNIIIVIMSYMKAQMEFSVGEEPYTLKHYIKEQFKLMPKLFKGHFGRVTGGGIEKMVIPKADEYRYANCISTQAGNMDRMKLLTKCILRRRVKGHVSKKISKAQGILMLQICQNFVFRKAESDVKAYFFKGHFTGKSINLIDENRIMQMEGVVSGMLTKRTKKKYKMEQEEEQEEGEVEEKPPESVNEVFNEEVEQCKTIVKQNQVILTKCNLRLMLLLDKLNHFNV